MIKQAVNACTMCTSAHAKLATPLETPSAAALMQRIQMQKRSSLTPLSLSLSLHINHSIIQLSLDAPLPLIKWPFKLVNFKGLFWNVLLSLPVTLFQWSKGSDLIKSGTYQKCNIQAGWFSTSLCISSIDAQCDAGGQGIHALMACIWISSFTCNLSRYACHNSNRLSGASIHTIVTDEKSWYL